MTYLNKFQFVGVKIMHKIFGITSNVDYIDSQTSKGYFHPIQNYYVGEIISKVAEPMETDHKFVWIGYDEIKGKMFVEM